LRAFLKKQDKANWPHHLTMARLVARALRLGRSALMQTSSSMSRYCISYLMPALMGDWSVILVVPQSLQEHLLTKEIPPLQNWLGTQKKIRTGDRWIETEDFQGLLLTTPEAWLSDRLNQQGYFPERLPTIIDRADDLEQWAIKELTVTIEPQDWHQLSQIVPEYEEQILQVQIKLTKAIFDRPQNPYECYLLAETETEILANLLENLADKNLLNPKFSLFWQKLPQESLFLWASLHRAQGKFSLHQTPTEVATALNPIWQKQPLVIIGSFLDLDASAPIYRQQLGLEELLCLKFSPNQQNEYIQLYLPDRFPLPNTPQFQGALREQLHQLVNLSSNVNQPIVILLEDVPLKAQISASLAAEFGSRVQVEKTDLSKNSILICGWSFWRVHQAKLSPPQLLILATLPLPSLENPLVASRVAYYKRQRQDWFRLYLLPTAIRTLQQAVLPLRQSQGVIAILDSRVNYRSYGKTILTALEPCDRINYIDPTWFEMINS
jgi:ATP-dependent DNA helicase DinG